MDPNKYIVGLEDIVLVGKAVMAISSTFAKDGFKTLNQSVANATSIILSKYYRPCLLYSP